MSGAGGISYNDAVTAANAAHTVKQEQEAGWLNPVYYKPSLPMFMKAIQCILGFIAYVIVEVNDGCGNGSTLGFFKFVSCGAFVATLVLWAVLLLKVPQRCLRCDCVNWPLVEFVFYVVTIGFYFFADLFLALQACGGGQKAGVSFGFFTLFAYIAETVMTFRVFWAKRRERNGPVSSPSEMENPSRY